MMKAQTVMQMVFDVRRGGWSWLRSPVLLVAMFTLLAIGCGDGSTTEDLGASQSPLEDCNRLRMNLQDRNLSDDDFNRVLEAYYTCRDRHAQHNTRPQDQDELVPGECTALIDRLQEEDRSRDAESEEERRRRWQTTRAALSDCVEENVTAESSSAGTMTRDEYCRALRHRISQGGDAVSEEHYANYRRFCTEQVETRPEERPTSPDDDICAAVLERAEYFIRKGDRDSLRRLMATYGTCFETEVVPADTADVCRAVRQRLDYFVQEGNREAVRDLMAAYPECFEAEAITPRPGSEADEDDLCVAVDQRMAYLIRMGDRDGIRALMAQYPECFQADDEVEEPAEENDHCQAIVERHRWLVSQGDRQGSSEIVANYPECFE
jgi:hypothetical protein